MHHHHPLNRCASFHQYITYSVSSTMGAALAKELRAPTPGTCMGWMAQRIMSMGNGSDSIDAVSQLSIPENTKPVILELLNP